MSTLYWGTALAQTDLLGLWVKAKVRPWPYWFIRRLGLFSVLLWRRYETSRIGWRLAWELSKVAVGLGPCAVHRRKK